MIRRKRCCSVTTGTLILPGLILLLGLSSCVEKRNWLKPDYPKTRRSSVVDIIHGQTVRDPYRWLEDGDSPETLRWVDQQNALTQRMLAPFASLKSEIGEELATVYGVDSVSNVYPRGDRFFTSRHTGLENHGRIYLAEGSCKAESRVVIDPNTFSEDGTVALDWWYPSPDGSLIAYGKSQSGSEKSTLYIRNVETGMDLPDVIPFTQYCNVAWNPDGSGFYYNRCPNPGNVPAGEENFHMRVYYHQVGTSCMQDRYVWGKGAPD